MEALAIIWAPVQTLERAANERRMLPGLVVVTICAILGLLSATIAVLGSVTRARFERSQLDLPPDVIDDFIATTEVSTIILSIASPFLWWMVVSLLMQLTTRFFGGNGPFSVMLAVVGLSFVPLALSSVLTGFTTAAQVALDPGSATSVAIGYLGLLLGYAFSLWQVVLVVIGAAFARQIGYGESAGSCAISCAGCLGSIIVLGIVLAIAIPVILSATGGGAQ